MRADGEKTLRIVDYCLQKGPHSIEDLSLITEVSEKSSWFRRAYGSAANIAVAFETT